MTAPAVVDDRHRTMVTARPATRTVWAVCGRCEWTLVVDYVHDDEAIVAIRSCWAEGLKHESAFRWLWAAMRRIARCLGICS